jgi:hypothetical protein
MLKRLAVSFADARYAHLAPGGGREYLAALDRRLADDPSPGQRWRGALAELRADLRRS